MERGRFSKKAKRHAAESRMRTKRMLSTSAKRSGPVTISYLPGYEPPAVAHEPSRLTQTKMPFEATINGEPYLVYRQGGKIVLEPLDEETPWTPPDPDEWEDLE